MTDDKIKKVNKIRNLEYYDKIEEFQWLYERGKENYRFHNLMELIKDEDNIKLAYRNIKNNKGATTAGVDGKTINDFIRMDEAFFIRRIKTKIDNYHPKSVRRVFIPKGNGKMRPLGIPCIEDRIIQQCIKQIIEPICESKFHPHSYGFRPLRNTHHAIARCLYLMNMKKLHYVVDVDIKSFFDNVDHGKLIKQLWHIGIRDKKVIKIISKILKSEIVNEGIPTKGTPQGGIISPLLANVTLNELDWWIESQWSSFPTKFDYKFNSHKFRHMREKSILKEMYIVRYADDFKIFCKDRETAEKTLYAVKKWLNERLKLNVSDEKTKITNLRRKNTEFLGFKLKLIKTRKKWVCKSEICNKAKKRILSTIRNQLKVMQREPNSNETRKLNSIILGAHNYYKSATRCVIDFCEIHFKVKRAMRNRLKHYIKRDYDPSESYKKLYKGYEGKTYKYQEVTIFPIYGCRTRNPMCFSQNLSIYNKEGFKPVHDELSPNILELIRHKLNYKNQSMNNKCFDNSIALIAGQKGISSITGRQLEIHSMECHHKIPRNLGGTDEYSNLMWIERVAHKLIHCTDEKLIVAYKECLNLDKKAFNKINRLRKLAEKPLI